MRKARNVRKGINTPAPLRPFSLSCFIGCVSSQLPGVSATKHRGEQSKERGYPPPNQNQLGNPDTALLMSTLRPPSPGAYSSPHTSFQWEISPLAPQPHQLTPGLHRTIQSISLAAVPPSHPLSTLLPMTITLKSFSGSP